MPQYPLGIAKLEAKKIRENFFYRFLHFFDQNSNSQFFSKNHNWKSTYPRVLDLVFNFRAQMGLLFLNLILKNIFLIFTGNFEKPSKMGITREPEIGSSNTCQIRTQRIILGLRILYSTTFIKISKISKNFRKF